MATSPPPENSTFGPPLRVDRAAVHVPSRTRAADICTGRASTRLLGRAGREHDELVPSGHSVVMSAVRSPSTGPHSP